MWEVVATEQEVKKKVFVGTTIGTVILLLISLL